MPLQKFQYELSIQGNERSLQRWLDHELDVMVHVHEVRHEYEKQQQLYIFPFSCTSFIMQVISLEWH